MEQLTTGTYVLNFYSLLSEFWTSLFVEGPIRVSSINAAPHLPLQLRQIYEVTLAQPDLPKETCLAISYDYERIRSLVFEYHHLTTIGEKMEFQYEHTSETEYLGSIVQATYKPP
jgi:hypothetical protein